MQAFSRTSPPPRPLARGLPRRGVGPEPRRFVGFRRLLVSDALLVQLGLISHRPQSHALRAHRYTRERKGKNKSYRPAKNTIRGRQGDEKKKRAFTLGKRAQKSVRIPGEPAAAAKVPDNGDMKPVGV